MIESNLLDNLSALVLHYSSWSHIILAIGIMIQGETTALLSMYLIANDALTWTGFIATTFAAFLVAETMLYTLGWYLKGTVTGEKIKQKIPYHESIERYIRGNVTKVLIASKFIIGSTMIVLFLTGWSRIPFKKFIKAQIASVLVWLPIMSILAYSLVYGLWYLKSTKVFTRVEIGIGALAIIILGGEYILKKLFRAGMFLETKAEELGEKIEKNLTE